MTSNEFHVFGLCKLCIIDADTQFVEFNGWYIWRILKKEKKLNNFY